MKFLLDADDDWIESLRLYLYPKLHDPLSAVGDKIGIKLYSLGHVGDGQLVGVLDEDEEVIEEEIDNLAQRNPIACLKELKDGRVSEGSWVLLHEDNPDLVEDGKQIHITMFGRKGGLPGREIYAHYEDDWRASPIDHLRSEHFEVEKGVSLASKYFDKHTYLVLK